MTVTKSPASTATAAGTAATPAVATTATASRSASAIHSKLDRTIQRILQQELKDPQDAAQFWRLINAHIRQRVLRRSATILLLVVTVLAAIIYVPQLNWTASAIGRIAMIWAIRPWWDWKAFDTNLCLWEKEPELEDSGPSYRFDPLETCDYCERIGEILRLQKPPEFEDFESYMRSNQPFVIEASTRPKSPATIRELLLVEDSQPCDIQSNIYFGREPRLNQIVEQTLDRVLLSSSSGRPRQPAWHVHYRNCRFAAIKASRRLWPRPDWLPMHLRPYRTSSLLMSYRPEVTPTHGQSTEDSPPAPVKSLDVRGMATVAQLWGERLLRLDSVTGECRSSCASLWLTLRPDETLVFDANRWRLSYVLEDDEEQEEEVEGEDGKEGKNEVVGEKTKEVRGTEERIAVSFVAEFEFVY